LLCTGIFTAQVLDAEGQSILVQVNLVWEGRKPLKNIFEIWFLVRSWLRFVHR